MIKSPPNTKTPAHERIAALEMEVRQLTLQLAALRTSAQAVIERWDSPLWKSQRSTASCLNDLRAALATPPAQPQPYAHHTIWRDATGRYKWDQYHDASCPLPQTWDDEVPQVVIALYTAEQARALRTGPTP